MGAPQPLGNDVLHYQEHYRDFFSEFQVVSIAADGYEATFRIVSRAESKRALQVCLTPGGFEIEQDSTGELAGTTVESFEQVLSAMDGMESYGTRLCDLVSDQLAAKLQAAATAAEDSSEERSGRG